MEGESILIPEVASQELWKKLNKPGYLKGYKPVEELVQPFSPTPEFFIARPVESLLPKHVGFKIHIPICWNDKDFFKMVDVISSVCQTSNEDGFRAMFKIGNPSKFATLNQSGRPTSVSFYKMGVIYPNLRSFENEFSMANFCETQRLADELSAAMKEFRSVLEPRKIVTDLELRPGAWIRFGSYGGTRVGGDEEEPFFTTLTDINAPHEQKMAIIEDLYKLGIKIPEGWKDNSLQYTVEQSVAVE